jgi:PAS domain S-box-containing protein
MAKRDPDVRSDGGDLSEGHFRSLVEQAVDLVAEIDELGRFVSVSDGFARVLGYAPAELLGRPALDWVHPDDRERVLIDYAALADTGSVRSVHRARHRDGSWRWIEDCACGFRSSCGRSRLLAIGRDITNTRRLEETLARQLGAERRVAALSHHFVGLEAEAIDAGIRQALQEAADLAGADRACLCAGRADGREPHAFYEWTAEPRWSCPPTPMAWSLRKLRAGEVFQISDPAQLPGIAAVERENLERRGVGSVLGIPVEAGEHDLGFLVFECMGRQRQWSEQEVMLLRMVGELFTAALQRKRAEEGLRETQAQLMQSHKLEAVGRLAGGIAHDFNNLLTVILGFSRPLLEELSADDPIREDVHEIHAAAERAAALTRELLTFSRRRSASSQPAEINEVLLGLEQLLGRLLGEDVELAMELDSALGAVRMDSHELEQVVMNIAVNARDAMPTGGSLWIRTRRCELGADEARRLGLPCAGPHALISVSDSGLGLDEATRKQMFDPFFTTKEPGKGTGLGLSIVYRLVEQAGGVIAASGAPGRGTLFEVHLPLAAAHAPEPAAPAPASEPRRGACVLLVEDADAVRRLTRRILEQNGYRVIEAGNGAEALALGDETLDEVDVLLTDLVMPRLGGRELAERLRARHPGLGVLFVSGYPQAPGDEAGLPLPEGVFLQKPFGHGTLLDALARALEGAA